MRPRRHRAIHDEPHRDVANLQARERVERGHAVGVNAREALRVHTLAPDEPQVRPVRHDVGDDAVNLAGLQYLGQLVPARHGDLHNTDFVHRDTVPL